MRVCVCVMIAIMCAGTGTAYADGSGSADAGSADAGSGSAAALRKACTDAMNATPKLAEAVVDVAGAKNEVGKLDDAGKKNEQVCVDAMAANPELSFDLIKASDEKIAKAKEAAKAQEHDEAAAEIAMNQRHVILAYLAMWLVAVGFLGFMWRRQRAMRAEIDRLRRDLEEASK